MKGNYVLENKRKGVWGGEVQLISENDCIYQLYKLWIFTETNIHHISHRHCIARCIFVLVYPTSSE